MLLDWQRPQNLHLLPVELEGLFSPTRGMCSWIMGYFSCPLHLSTHHRAGEVNMSVWCHINSRRMRDQVIYQGPQRHHNKLAVNTICSQNIRTHRELLSLSWVYRFPMSYPAGWTHTHMQTSIWFSLLYSGSWSVSPANKRRNPRFHYFFCWNHW